MSAIVLIPARMAATRLPGKPLAEIGGKPMIVRVLERAEAANIGPVAVATDSGEIKAAVEKAGGKAVLTSPDHPSGSDRIFEALQTIDPDVKYEIVINLQGDIPFVLPTQIASLLALLNDQAVDISTLAAVIRSDEERDDPSVVKAIGTPIGENRLRALYFTRVLAPSGDGPHYHHVGLYGYRRAALERFVALPVGHLERRERLEQLRALEAGMRIDIGLIDTPPFGIDTPDQLANARQRQSNGE